MDSLRRTFLSRSPFLREGGNLIGGCEHYPELQCLRHLRELKADGNKLTSLDGLERMDGLVKLSVQGNAIKAVDLEDFRWCVLRPRFPSVFWHLPSISLTSFEWDLPSSATYFGCCGAVVAWLCCAFVVVWVRMVVLVKFPSSSLGSRGVSSQHNATLFDHLPLPGVAYGKEAICIMVVLPHWFTCNRFA